LKASFGLSFTLSKLGDFPEFRSPLFWFSDPELNSSSFLLPEIFLFRQRTEYDFPVPPPFNPLQFVRPGTPLKFSYLPAFRLFRFQAPPQTSRSVVPVDLGGQLLAFCNSASPACQFDIPLDPQPPPPVYPFRHTSFGFAFFPLFLLYALRIFTFRSRVMVGLYDFHIRRSRCFYL